MRSTIQERLVQLAKTKERSVRKFERECGLTEGYINAIRQGISKDKLDKIIQRYTDTNREWVLTGEGQMLVQGDEEVPSTIEIPSEAWNQISRLTEAVMSQQRTIELQAQSLNSLLRGARIESIGIAGQDGVPVKQCN